LAHTFVYKSRTTNVVVLAASVAVFAVSLWLVRSQIRYQISPT
jgi:hypothetical protein